jgi:hypothetical protein
MNSHPATRGPLGGLRPLNAMAMALTLVAGLATGCSSDDTSGTSCTKDSDCKGDRLCADGTCVDPSTTTTTTTTTTSGAGGSGGASSGNGSGGASTTSSTTAASNAASTGAGQMCDGGKVDCGGACIDTMTNNEHCGACGNVCAFNETCGGGKCNPKPCYALSFNGKGDHVTVPASADFAYGSEFTVEVWMNATKGVDYPRVLSHEASGSNNLYTSWEIDGVNALGQVRFQTNNSASNQAFTTLVKQGTWAHVAAVVTGGTSIKLFVDGKPSGQGTGVFTGDTTKVPLGIGAQVKYLTDYPYAGSLGPIRLSKKARYTQEFSPTWGWPSDADTIAVWNMFEGLGATLGDLSSGKHDGAITGATWVPGKCGAPPPPKPSWKSKGTKTATVMTGSCANTAMTTAVCDAKTLGVEARVLDMSGIELKPLADLQETGALQGRTATVSADGATLSLTGETGCGGDKLITATVTSYVCE